MITNPLEALKEIIKIIENDDSADYTDMSSTDIIESYQHTLDEIWGLASDVIFSNELMNRS